ncbi:MAG: hypothetical protein OES69_07100 [Myxococcales bacterium]|nr:hypothetical protein [Myxococcales bacterium]MDH3843688.1 hypothetical protein [Myxococcales bacterium]
MASMKLLFTSLLLTATFVGCGNGGTVGAGGGGGTAGVGGFGGIPWEPDGMWGVAEPIETAASTRQVELAVDASGNAVAVWVRDGEVWSNRWTPGSSRGTPVRIDDGAPPGYILFPQVAIDPSGNAVAVWGRHEPGVADFTMWWNRWTPGDGWGTAERIDTDDDLTDRPPDILEHPEVAIDAGGNVVVVWPQTEGNHINIWSNRRTPNGGWGTAQLIESNDALFWAFGPEVAVDPSGNAIAVWIQMDYERSGTWSNRWTPEGGWGTAEYIGDDDDSGIGGGQLQVAIDASGHAIAVWKEPDQYVWSNRWTPEGGWGTAERIHDDAPNVVGLAQVAVDGSGNVVAVWVQSDGALSHIHSNRWTADGGWGTAERIETEDAEDAWYPQVTVDARGNAVAVWEYTVSDTVWTNRWTPSGGWGTPERINTYDPVYAEPGHSSRPRVAIDASGNAVAVWSQEDGVWWNRFEKK